MRARADYGIQIDFYHCDAHIPEMRQCLYANGPAYAEMVFSSEKLAEMQNLMWAWSRWNALEWWNQKGPNLRAGFRAAYGPEADVLCRVVNQGSVAERHVYAFVYKSGDDRRIRLLLDINEIRVFAIFFHATKWTIEEDIGEEYFRMWWPRRAMFRCSSAWDTQFLQWVQTVGKEYQIAWMDTNVKRLHEKCRNQTVGQIACMDTEVESLHEKCRTWTSR